MKYEKWLILGSCGLVLVFALMADPAPDLYDQQRQSMLEKIQQDTRRTKPFTGIDKISEEVMYAMEIVPRHHFVPTPLEYLAYLNRPLPIGESQTISQPFIVALMTEFLDPQPEDKILEIGTGSGYQAAVLAVMARQIYSLEIIESLASEASERLHVLGYDNVSVIHTDGSHGWPQGAPYNKIIVTAASPRIPQTLIEQLASPGIMVIPIGPQDEGQELIVLQKNASGTLSQRSILPVRFVPFTGDVETSLP